MCYNTRRCDKRWKYFYICFTVLWICFIFSFSLREGEVSNAMSNKVGQVIIENSSSEVSEKFDDLSWYEQKQFHAVLRKCGHFAEFFILGVLTYLMFCQMNVVHKVFRSLGLCMLVGAMDESIQLFVDGRSGRLSDVIIDSYGALVGICVTYLMINKVIRCVKSGL